MFTEAEKQEWLKKNTFFCELRNVRISEQDCKQRRNLANVASRSGRREGSETFVMSVAGYVKDDICKGCERFGKPKPYKTLDNGSATPSKEKLILQHVDKIKIMSSKEVAHNFGVSVQYFYQIARKHDLEYVKGAADMILLNKRKIRNMTVPEIAEKYGVGAAYVRQLASQYKFKYKKQGE